jgi:hypothetical protein
MARKKRNLFRELAAGIRAMRDHAEEKIELRTTFVSASPTGARERRQRADAVPATEPRQGVADVGVLQA